MPRRLSILVLAFFALVPGAGVFEAKAQPLGAGIDQEAMYGGMDRAADPRLKAADEEFIAGVTREFGSREAASEKWVDQGFVFYFQDNYAKSMRRFNQAWLLNPENPDVFHGFAVVYHDEGRNCDARDMIVRALDLGLDDPMVRADAGRIYTLGAVSDKKLDDTAQASAFAVSDGLYEQATAAAPQEAYIYGSWATACYWRGDYARAWEMVAASRELGQEPSDRFLKLLKKKMREPR
jgi:Flp pilus assembly protein TadD